MCTKITRIRISNYRMLELNTRRDGILKCHNYIGIFHICGYTCVALTLQRLGHSPAQAHVGVTHADLICVVKVTPTFRVVSRTS